MISRSMPLLILPFLAGCAASPGGDYPSLALRPAEMAARAPAPAPSPAAPAPVDPAVATQVAALVDRAKQGDAAFADALNAAEPRIRAGAGSPAGSESWVVAQQALAGVEAARGASTGALAAVDSMLLDAMERAATGADASGGDAALRAAQAEIGAIVDRQNARLDSLKAALSPGR